MEDQYQSSRPPSAPSLAAAGAAGVFEGLQSDRVVFAHYRRHGSWSPGLAALLRQVLAGGGTLLDLGANLGLLGLPLSARTPARVLCFEPERRNAALLRRNAAREGRRGASCFEVALHDRTGPLGLSVDRDNAGDHHLAAAAQARALDGDVVVMGRRLDDLLAPLRLQPPVVMKLDVQGSEARVLRGARRTLRSVDLLAVEYWPFGLARQGSSVEALWAELRGFSYGCVLPQAGPLPEPMTVPELLRSLSWIQTSDPGFFDLLLWPARPHSPRWRNARAASNTPSM